MLARSLQNRDKSLSSALLAGAVLAGVAFPALSGALLPFIFTALFVVVLCSLSTLEENPTKVLTNIDVFTWTIVSWQMFIVPAVVTVICVIFAVPSVFTMILLATTTAGSVFAGPALVQMAGLNRPLAVRTMVITTFTMPISLLLFGTMNDLLPPDMSFASYLRHIAIYLAIPLLASAVIFKLRSMLSRPVEAHLVRGLNWVSTLALMVFCCGVMSKIRGPDGMHQELLVEYFFLAVGLAALMYVATTVIFSRFGKFDSLTAGMLVANRNVALSFGLMSEIFPDAVMVYVAVAQFPIFMTPFAIRIFRMVQREFARADEVPPDAT